MNTFETGLIDELIIVPEQRVQYEFDAQQSAALAVKALSSLGLVKDQGAALDYFGRSAEALSNIITDEDGVVLTPVETFPTIPLTVRVPLLGSGGLLERFDGKAETESYVYAPLWTGKDQNHQGYSLAEINRRTFVESGAPEPAVLPAHMRGMLLGGGYSVEPSLYFTNQTADEQRASIEQFQKVTGVSASDALVLLQNPADIIMINSQRRELGEKLLDTQVFRRFLQLGFNSAGGASCVGSAYSDDGRFYLGGSAGAAHPGEGVGLSVGPKELKS